METIKYIWDNIGLILMCYGFPIALIAYVIYKLIYSSPLLHAPPKNVYYPVHVYGAEELIKASQSINTRRKGAISEPPIVAHITGHDLSSDDVRDHANYINAHGADYGVMWVLDANL